MNAKTGLNPTPFETLIVGLGNVLLGDEGVGVHIVRELEGGQLPIGVETLDGGTGGFHLLGPLCQAHRIVFIDATMDGRPEGTIQRIEPQFAEDYPNTLSAHDIGIKDMLDALHLIGQRVPVVLITISIQLMSGLSVELSEPIAAAAQRVVEMVNAEFITSKAPLAVAP
ncbi:MAG: hydrogenase maturation protease [Acidobacteria bacterium]|nr:hydrogenase maturation protease [Acidobacteriota bacterium]MCB9397620.1 hydrogenase maturation protease [Acidobacteriota bacterium]